MGYLLASPLRRMVYQPATLLAPYVRPGMTVLEPGPGMGFFTLEMARLVSGTGRVVVVDIQPRMLDALRRKAAKAGVLERLDVRLARPESMGISDLQGRVDFTLAFAVVHELPDASEFFQEVARVSRSGARLLFAEPSGHVTVPMFEAELRSARDAGFAKVEELTLRRSRAVLLQKSAA